MVAIFNSVVSSNVYSYLLRLSFKKLKLKFVIHKLRVHVLRSLRGMLKLQTSSLQIKRKHLNV